MIIQKPMLSDGGPIFNWTGEDDRKNFMPISLKIK